MSARDCPHRTDAYVPYVSYVLPAVRSCWPVAAIGVTFVRIPPAASERTMPYPALLVLLAALVVSVPARVTRVHTPPHMSTDATPHAPRIARGTFTVTIVPQPADTHADGAAMGRMTLDKRFIGDIEATGVGQMLTGMGGTKGSAVYSAIERVTGTVHGRRGSFMLQHTGIMTRGAQSLRITVVPDSGTDDLAGITGELAIVIEGGVHSYVFTYELPGR